MQFLLYRPLGGIVSIKDLWIADVVEHCHFCHARSLGEVLCGSLRAPSANRLDAAARDQMACCGCFALAAWRDCLRASDLHTLVNAGDSVSTILGVLPAHRDKGSFVEVK
jgi:hypothetical protein